MTISDFRKREGHELTLEQFGELIGKSKGHVHAIEQDNKCSAKLALRIEAVTDGLVDAASLNDEIAQARRIAA